MATLREIVFDCEKPSALARFWAAVLDGYRVRAYTDAEIARLAERGLTPETDPVVLVDGPGPMLCFQRRVPALAPNGKRQKGKVHLDVVVADRKAEVDRLLALGASLQRQEVSYTVLQDPEGNPFCIQEIRKDL
jgi:hypothetical protein